jgi:recombination protein RecT
MNEIAIHPENLVTLTPTIQRLTAPNAGIMTGPGTNSYLVGTPESGFIVIDPGPNHPEHIHNLHRSTGGNIRMIVCTHSHADHSPAAFPLQALCPHQPPVLGLPSADTARPNSFFRPDRALQNNELLTLDSCALQGIQAIFTPGHAANHVCFLAPDQGILFSGDHILNGSTTVVEPPDGNMGQYLASLELLQNLCQNHAVHYILPAHGMAIGGTIEAVVLAIEHLRRHRRRRESKVIAVTTAHPDKTVDDWLPLVYDDVPPALWPVARRSLLAHLEHIGIAITIPQ